MPDNFGWSQDVDGDVVTVCETIVAASALTETVVFSGRADVGTLPPFITVWHLDPQRTGEGLAGEAWGVAHQQYQLSAHGVSQSQARYLAEQICDPTVWPSGWELAEIGPMVEDTADHPTTWFLPLTFVYRNTTV